MVVIFPTETVGLVEVPKCSTLCCFSELQRMATWAGTLRGALSGSFCKIECGISLNIYFRAKFMLRKFKKKKKKCLKVLMGAALNLNLKW